jgi:hypothetical protein
MILIQLLLHMKWLCHNPAAMQMQQMPLQKKKYGGYNMEINKVK